jgi:hypothetical protein
MRNELQEFQDMKFFLGKACRVQGQVQVILLQ